MFENKKDVATVSFLIGLIDGPIDALMNSQAIIDSFRIDIELSRLYRCRIPTETYFLAIMRFQDTMSRLHSTCIYPLSLESIPLSKLGNDRLGILVNSIATGGSSRDREPCSCRLGRSESETTKLRKLSTTLSIENDSHEAKSSPTAALLAILAATSETSPGDPADPQLKWWSGVEFDSRYKADPIVGPMTAPKPRANENPVRSRGADSDPFVSRLYTG
jgi:hypothetical protein